MICVSVGEDSVEGCVRALEGVEFAEVRMDKIHGLGGEGVKRIFSEAGKGKKLMATFRVAAENGGKGGGENGEEADAKEQGKRIGDKEREGLLIEAIEAGAAYVDLELEMEKGMRGRIIEAAKKAGCEVVVSFHDFGGTPPAEELERIAGECFGAGADIAKVACTVNSEGDNARLLGLLGGGRRLVVIGMGEKGEKTRVLAPILGAQFTFASLGKGRETAPGQLEIGELEGIIRLIEERMEKE
jgi:3-dehydroquinate dehydratase-1